MKDRSRDRVMVTNEMKVHYWFALKHVFEVRGFEMAESPRYTSNLAEEKCVGQHQGFQGLDDGNLKKLLRGSVCTRDSKHVSYPGRGKGGK